MLKEIIYTSEITGLFHKRTIRQVLDIANTHNPRIGVSGVLFFDGTVFMQIMEGPEGPLNILYDRICADTRHKNVTLIHEGPIAKPAFEGWHMRFEPVLPQSLNLNKFSASLLRVNTAITQNLTYQDVDYPSTEPSRQSLSTMGMTIVDICAKSSLVDAD